jgi:hypothetical protein
LVATCIALFSFLSVLHPQNARPMMFALEMFEVEIKNSDLIALSTHSCYSELHSIEVFGQSLKPEVMNTRKV